MFALGALSFAMLASSAQANQVTTVPGFGPWDTGSYGEFTVIGDLGVAAQLGGYSQYTINQGGYANSFQTFGIETSESIAEGTTYDVTFNNITIFTGDPLSAGVAYLYQQFATGNLNYNYANSPGSRTASASSLQNALLYLMNPSMNPGQASNPYVLMADSALGGVGEAFAPDNGAHGVSVLNLWAPGQPHDPPPHASEDVLIYTGSAIASNVPDQSSTLVLGALSIVATLAFRPRK
jgi:opacity protein-like surface antigen